MACQAGLAPSRSTMHPGSPSLPQEAHFTDQKSKSGTKDRSLALDVEKEVG